MPAPTREKLKRQRADGGLKAIQRLTASAVMRPLDAEWESLRTWSDGRSTEDVVSEVIKPNSRLSSFERVEIYNRQYWFRLYDCMHDDFPGLRAVVGEDAFQTLIRAYLAACPSRSFTLRNLGSRLPEFVRANPKLTGRQHRMAIDMADFEWAQVVAFDGPSSAPIDPTKMQGADPTTLRLDLQPYLTLLDMAYPLDAFFSAVKRRDASLRGEASNAVTERRSRAIKPVPLPKRKQTRIAVHRHDNAIYIKQLTAPAYATLVAIRDGQTLADACAIGTSAGRVKPNDFANWFALWAELGWLVKRTNKQQRSKS
jgi:hypothetical protein